MKRSQISKSEWIIMELLWDESPKTAMEVTNSLEFSTGWAVNTVRTLLTRLAKKEVLKSDKNEAGMRVFYPVVEREDCVAKEAKSFANRFFGGATKSLFVHFAEQADLSASDVKDLKKMLDQHSDGKGLQ